MRGISRIEIGQLGECLWCKNTLFRFLEPAIGLILSTLVMVIFASEPVYAEEDPGEPEVQTMSKGSKSVSSNGNFTHSIPIQTPIGTNGQSVGISLEYSSTEANSKVGIGWSLDGIPSIGH